MPETESPTQDIWANMKALTGVAEVEKLFSQPQEWFTNQPVIQGLLSHPVTKPMLSWLEAKENIAMFSVLIGQCGIAFLETSHGINRAYNSKAHANLAGAGEAALSAVISTSTEKGIYGDVINAFNDSLNLPELAKTGIKINQDVGEAWASLEKERLAAIQKALKLRNKLFKQLESPQIKLEERKKLRAEYDNVAKSLVGMGEKPIAPPKKATKPKKGATSTPIPTPTPNSGLGEIIGHNPYNINSIYNDRISSIRSIKVNASALVLVPVVAPIVAVGGAIATVGITAGIISTIASWFLGNCMNLVGLPAGLTQSLVHCVTSIVLKVSGSAGAESLRFFAASALKANAALLMKVFGISNMNVTAWMFLTAMAVPILIVSIIIILAMRNKNKVIFSHFYLLAEHDRYPGFAYASIQNADDARIEFATMKKDLLELANITYSGIYGVGIEVENGKPEVKGGFNLATDTPRRMNSADAKKALEDFATKHSVSIPLGAWKPV